jgi:hypothetical protein
LLKTKELIKAIGVGVAIGIAFACAQVDIARSSQSISISERLVTASIRLTPEQADGLREFRI